MTRIQYKQIERIAAKQDVSFTRCRHNVDGGMVPAVRLGGFLSNIQAAVREIESLAGDGRYYVERTDSGFYLYV